MGKKKYVKAIDIYNDKQVYAQFINLVEQKETVDFILNFLADKGYPIARGTYYNILKKRTQSKTLGVPLGDLLKGNMKDSLEDVDENKLSKSIEDNDIVGGADYDVLVEDPSSVPSSVVEAEATDKIWTTQQVLESIIQKGAKAIEAADYVDVTVLLKALDTYMKFFGDNQKGLTMAGLRQYAIYTETRLTGIQEVLLEYVPTDKQKEAAQAIDDKQAELIHELELSKGGREFIDAIKKAGVEL